MVIEIPGCGFRIEGTDRDWSIQYPYTDKGETAWRGKYFYVALEHAVAKAYELALRKSDAVVDLAGVPEECAKVKRELVAAVRKAAAK